MNGTKKTRITMVAEVRDGGNLENGRTRNYQVQRECGRTRRTRGTGEQDPGLPGFGVRLSEHSSNPGVKRREGKSDGSAGCLGHGGNGGRAQLYRGYVCRVAEVRGLSGM